MKLFDKIILVTLCLALSAILSMIHFFIVDMPQENARYKVHQAVINSEAPAPLQYRALPFFFAEVLHKLLNLSLTRVYFVLRLLFTFLSLYALYQLLGYFFEPEYCYIGVLYTAAVIPITYFGYTMAPGDIMALWVIIQGLNFIMENRYVNLGQLIVLGVLMRETVLVLVPIYFLVNFGKKSNSQVIIDTLLYGIIGISTFIGVRLLYGSRELYYKFFTLWENLTHPGTYLFLFLFFNIMLFLPFFGFKHQPGVLRRLFIVVIPFFLINLCFGLVRETRLMLPLLPILVPMSISTLRDRIYESIAESAK